MTNDFRIRMALTLCKEFKESNTQAMVQALKEGNRELAEWFEGKARAYENVIRMIKEDY